MKKRLNQTRHVAGARKLSVLDRLRGWHWSTKIVDAWYNEGVPVRRRNMCGCEL